LYAESFIGRLRDECLNENGFISLKNAREIIESWRIDYSDSILKYKLNLTPGVRRI